MLEIVLTVTDWVGHAALLAAGVVLPLVFFTLVLAEQLQGLQRADAEALVPAAWKRALAGGWSLRGKLRLPRRQRLH